MVGWEFQRSLKEWENVHFSSFKRGGSADAVWEHATTIRIQLLRPGACRDTNKIVPTPTLSEAGQSWDI